PLAAAGFASPRRRPLATRRARGASQTFAYLGRISHNRVHLVYRVRGPVPATHVGYALRSPSGTWSAHPIELPRLDYISFGPNPVGLAVDPDGGAHIAYSRIGETLVYGHRRDCP